MVYATHIHRKSDVNTSRSLMLIVCLVSVSILLIFALGSRYAQTQMADNITIKFDQLKEIHSNCTNGALRL